MAIYEFLWHGVFIEKKLITGVMGRVIDGNYWVITLFSPNMIIYPSVWRIMHNYRYPQFLQHFYIQIH